MSDSAGWPPGLSRVSASSASLGAASTIGEVATGGAGAASTRALCGRARSRLSDVVDSGIHTSGGEPAPGNGTGCSACWAWSTVSGRTRTAAQRPATRRLSSVYERASSVSQDTAAGSVPTLSVVVGPAQPAAGAGDPADRVRTVTTDARHDQQDEQAEQQRLTAELPRYPPAVSSHLLCRPIGVATVRARQGQRRAEVPAAGA